MSRDHRKLRVFTLADELVLETYRRTVDYLRFLSISLGSASEARYLLSVANRLGLLSADHFAALEPRYEELLRSLQKRIDALAAEP